MLALLVLALVASAYADSKCPEVKAVENFNLASYAKGKWYEVGSYPIQGMSMYKCGVAEYYLEGDSFKLNNSGVYNNKVAFIEGSGKLAENAGNKGIILFSLPYGKSGKISEHIYNILDIDYDNYLIGYYCKYDEQKNSHEDYSWILSRSKVLSSDVKSKIDKFIKESEVLNSSRYIWSDFSDEACSVVA